MNGKELTHIDLFTGIGGFSLASHWAGFTTVAFCEKDNWCQQVIRKHWPSVPIHGDIRNFPGHLYRGATLLTGGFPCQPFSQCGKRRGKEDDRYLWPEMFSVIQDVRPNWVVLENVPNVIRMALPSVIADLEKEGYGAFVFVLPAHGVGAPHRRRRAFVVAESLNTDTNSVRPYREEMHANCKSNSLKLRHEQECLPRQMVPEQVWKAVDSRVFRVDNGVSFGMDRYRKQRIKGLGNAVVPILVYQILKAIALVEMGENNVDIREECPNSGG